MRAQSTEEYPTAKRYIKAFLFGILAGVLLLAVIYLLFSLVYAMTDLPSGVLLGMVFVGLVLSGALSGCVAAGLVGKKGMIVGAINGFLFALLFLLIGVCFFSSGISLMQGIKTVLIVFSSVCGGIFGVNRKKIRI